MNQTVTTMEDMMANTTLQVCDLQEQLEKVTRVRVGFYFFLTLKWNVKYPHPILNI